MLLWFNWYITRNYRNVDQKSLLIPIITYIGMMCVTFLPKSWFIERKETLHLPHAHDEYFNNHFSNK